MVLVWTASIDPRYVTRDLTDQNFNQVKININSSAVTDGLFVVERTDLVKFFEAFAEIGGI